MSKQDAGVGGNAAGTEGRLNQTFNDAVEVGQLFREHGIEHGISTVVLTMDLREVVALRNMLQQRDDVRCVLRNLVETVPTPSSDRKNTAEAKVGSPQSQALAEARELLHKWDLADYCALTRERSDNRMQDLYKAAEHAGIDLTSVPTPRGPSQESHDGRSADDQQ